MAKQKVTVFGIKVSEDDAEEFLSEIGIKPCDVCDHSLWDVTISPPDRDEYLAIWTTKDQSTLGGNHLPIYTAACSNCGFIRTFLLHPLTEWVSKRDSKDG